MKHLYCPWRQAYSESIKGKAEDTKPDACVFCELFAQTNDEQHFILKRTQYNVIMLNKFPYNAGHLLILPQAHVCDLSLMEQEARTEMMELCTIAIELVRTAINAQGVNTGMNLGKISGGGIPSHLHQHIVPRYQGDTNFMATVAHTKAISYDLINTFETLKKHLASFF